MAKCLNCEGRVKKFFLIGLGEMGRICVKCNTVFDMAELYKDASRKKREQEMNSKVYKTTA